jgi:hypothetical protein
MEKEHKTGSLTECVQTIIDNQLKELESMEKETLEEAFETFKKQYPVLKNYSLHNLLQVARFGAKWQKQQDNNYSEEYISEKLFNHSVIDRIRSSKSDAEARRIILQQFKK